MSDKDAEDIAEAVRSALLAIKERDRMTVEQIAFRVRYDRSTVTKFLSRERMPLCMALAIIERMPEAGAHLICPTCRRRF